jgi:hypothetical protein
VATIDPAGFAVLAQIKAFGLHEWLPGRYLIARLGDSTFTRVNARIVGDLLREGYLQDTSGDVTVALAGEHELSQSGARSRVSSRFSVDGLWFQVDTDDWGVDADATRVRTMVRSGLTFLGATNGARLLELHDRLVAHEDDEVFTAILLAAVTTVTAQYGDEFGRHRHRVGVRAYRIP